MSLKHSRSSGRLVFIYPADFHYYGANIYARIASLNCYNFIVELIIIIVHEVTPKPEKAIAASVIRKGGDREKALEYLDELEFLAETAGAEVVEKIYQELENPNSATVVGKGKLEELKLTIEDEGINLIIFDDDLSPAQVRNLEKALDIKVMDRSGIILDIFAGRAKTLEAKTQVELAQLQYMLPRLTRMWTHLSKQYGGIGTKGPGETQIETDRRIIRTRIQLLKEKLLDMDTQREQQRKKRESMPRFALVGYTNAGKSTLMNTITNSDVYIEDKLFATLDTTVRTFDMPGGQRALLSDTVGFIRKLPAHLVASFRSTLAEASEADVLLHVVDISNPHYKDHIEVVDKTLESLKIDHIPTLVVFNKIDAADEVEAMAAKNHVSEDSIFISAKRGLNVQTLLQKMQELYEEKSKDIRLMLPYSRMDMAAKLYNFCDILERNEKDEGIEFYLRVTPENYEYIKNSYGEYIINE
ncbi:MAG: GTPase HflX [Candidatus Kapaibacterium sp.]